MYICGSDDAFFCVISFLMISASLLLSVVMYQWNNTEGQTLFEQITKNLLACFLDYCLLSVSEDKRQFCYRNRFAFIVHEVFNLMLKNDAKNFQASFFSIKLISVIVSKLSIF